MKIYLLTQDKVRGWDTHDSVVVIAKDEESAKKISPSLHDEWSEEHQSFGITRIDGTFNISEELYGSWPSHHKDVTAEYIGTAVPGCEAGVVCSSFNAG